MKVKLRVVRSGLSAKSFEKSKWYVSKWLVVSLVNGVSNTVVHVMYIASGVSCG